MFGTSSAIHLSVPLFLCFRRCVTLLNLKYRTLVVGVVVVGVVAGGSGGGSLQIVVVLVVVFSCVRFWWRSGEVVD